MAPRGRRAGRRTPAQLARLRSSIKKRELAQIAEDARNALAKGIQAWAVQSMNSLAQKGPAWTGEFSASWGFAPEGRTPNTPGTTGRIYKYTKNDVPIRDVRRFVRDGVTRFSIVNTAPHAAIAIDEEEAMFAPPSYFPVPIGDVVAFGTDRPEDEHLRYQIRYREGDDVTSQITAEKDWFATYLRGGGLQQDLNIGFTREFRS